MMLCTHMLRMHGAASSRIPAYKSATRRAADNANYADAGTISSAREGKPNYGQYMQQEQDAGVETPQLRMYLDGEPPSALCA